MKRTYFVAYTRVKYGTRSELNEILETLLDLDAEDGLRQFIQDLRAHCETEEVILHNWKLLKS